jgi:hypothetical protein
MIANLFVAATVVCTPVVFPLPGYAEMDNIKRARSLKAVNAELAKRGFDVQLAKGNGYFYFVGEAADWLDRTVRLPTLHSLTLDHWMEECRKLRETNRQLMGIVEPGPAEPTREGACPRRKLDPPLNAATRPQHSKLCMFL